MLNAAISFFILGIIAFFLGAYGIAGLSIEIGKLLLIAFLFLALISFFASLIRRKGHKQSP